MWWWGRLEGRFWNTVLGFSAEGCRALRALEKAFTRSLNLECVSLVLWRGLDIILMAAQHLFILDPAYGWWEFLGACGFGFWFDVRLLQWWELLKSNCIIYQYNGLGFSSLPINKCTFGRIKQLTVIGSLWASTNPLLLNKLHIKGSCSFLRLGLGTYLEEVLSVLCLDSV